jgi:pyridoxine/pyridoxamine 5'-phosphate oxidase
MLFHHQRQIEMVGSVCDVVDKVLQEAHKFYRLRTQQGPVVANTLKQSCIVHHI